MFGSLTKNEGKAGSSFIESLFKEGKYLPKVMKWLGPIGDGMMAYDQIKDTDLMTGRRSADKQAAVDADIKARNLDPNDWRASTGKEVAKIPTVWDMFDDWFGGKKSSPAVLNNATSPSSSSSKITIESKLVLNERELAKAVNEVNTRDANRR